MSSQLFQKIGLGNLDIAYIFIAMLVFILILIILVILQISKASKLTKRYEKFMNGKDAKSLEKEIERLFEDNKYLRNIAEENKRDIRNIYKNLEVTFQKIGIVKYDAFQHMGGKLSFCLVLLNDKDNGFVLNSVHSSDGCYSYTKEIKSGECELALGEEEKEALAQALKSNIVI